MIRIVELFCGIGGCSAALGGRGQVVAAVDINRDALAVYERNFPHSTLARAIDTLPSAAFAAWEADLWWLSPPCQPFTERGLRRDVEDPRARPFLVLLERIAEHRPCYVALENVPGFVGSEVHRRLRRTLEEAGYGAVHEGVLCPSEAGVPNRRRRFYLVASTEGLLPLGVPIPDRRPLAAYLDPEPAADLTVDPAVLEAYEGALDVVDADDSAAMTRCFTSAYARSHVRSGSYLRQNGVVRRFSPAEILRLLGFPESFFLPDGMSYKKAWRLVANSLSLGPVRRVLAAVPPLGAGRALD